MTIATRHVVSAAAMAAAIFVPVPVDARGAGHSAGPRLRLLLRVRT